MSDITTRTNYEAASVLDPLNFDSYAADLPQINTAEDVESLASQYQDMLNTANSIVIEGADSTVAGASLRDIDFVASSLLRHGEAEIAESHFAQLTLASLARIAGTVPRGTVFTYAASNPSGDRRRSFTGAREENLFIDAVSEGINGLDDCIDAVRIVTEGDSSQLDTAGEHMQKLVTSIIAVRRGMTPDFFTHSMRPYFEPLVVDGTAYAGAGGAQMQVIAVDRMVWGADCEDKDYDNYYRDNVRYLTPEQRGTVAEFEAATDGKSVVTLIRQGELPSDAALPTIGLLKTLRKFRYPHRKVAQDNFALRPDNSVGSGKYTLTALDQLITLNEQAIADLEEIV